MPVSTDAFSWEIRPGTEVGAAHSVATFQIALFTAIRPFMEEAFAASGVVFIRFGIARLQTIPPRRKGVASIPCL